ncbi:hypothetical protein [uncultured Paludibaculum sp.]|uniref:hypothetical protein n=1 Tax=uncultured Paludibaculum sp. TaxID=1765020 RepID=UPI002AABBE97|nr:hypothetical protein [uncultured Paludibaculum sp.]
MERRQFLGGLAAAPVAALAAGWDEAGQRRRRAEIYALHQRDCGPKFDESGQWIAASTPPGGRERLWHAISLLKSEATRAKANAIITRTFEMRNRKEFQWTFSHFEFTASVQILAADKGELTTANRELLSSLVRETFARKGAIRWLGYNDNFPAMELVVAVLGGEMFQDDSAVQRGIASMRALLEYFESRGLLSEYTSSTYSPVTLLCISNVAEYARSSEARSLALQLEQRIWLDVATHFHAPTNILAGPHSRAYSVDSVGHLHQIHMLFYQAFGEKLWLNPKRFLFPPIEHQEIHHDGDVPFMQCSNVWIASGTYHPSLESERLAFQKPFPFRVTGTTEHGTAVGMVMNRDASGKFVPTQEVMEYQGGECVTTTYMTPDYAVGSATVQMHDGNQTDAFFVNYKRAPRPESIKDTGTIYCRYCINDDRPGYPWSDPRSAEPHPSHDILADAGRVRAVQKDGCVLALYQAKAQFLDDYRALRLTVVLPAFYRELKRVEFDAKDGMVWVEDDCLYAAFRPLILTNHGRKEAVRIEKDHGFTAIQFINYEGSARRFSRKALLETCNGFVAELGSPAEDASFDKFRSKVLAGVVSDETAAGHRITSYHRPGIRLDLCHTLYYSQVKHILVDGKPQPRPMLAYTGSPAVLR